MDQSTFPSSTLEKCLDQKVTTNSRAKAIVQVCEYCRLRSGSTQLWDGVRSNGEADVTGAELRAE